jgi:DDE family transposase
MRLSHARRAIGARFDDPNLVSCAGLAPVVALADRCGLPQLLADRLTVAGKAGANAAAKVLALVSGMVAGADSISDMDLLRHGGMPRLFDQVRAPSTLGVFLRAFTFGHVRQLDAVAARLLARLCRAAPLLPGADRLAYLDIDDTVRGTYGYAKQGAGRGYSGVNGLNALLAVLSTPGSAPVIAAARLRRGASASVRGAGKLVADALATARRAGVTATLVVRGDSAFYAHDLVAACQRAGAYYSLTVREFPSVVTAISRIDEQAWVPIRYRNAIYDEDAQRWVSEAEVAEISFTAFTGRPRRDRVTARLVVRRVRRLNPGHAPAHIQRKHPEQAELFAVYRYHAIFTDNPAPLLEAEAAHRDHAIVEQVIADLKDSALAHLPSGKFTANAAWLACATIAHNLTRTAGALASTLHARARTGTIRAQLIHTPARIARSANRLVLHLPRDWPWEPGLDELFRRALHDPLPTAA